MNFTDISQNPLNPLAFDLFRLANAMVYYGLTINTSDMGVDPYANYFFSCMVEVPALILALLLIDRMGRRKMFFFFMFTAGIACIVTAFTPARDYF